MTETLNHHAHLWIPMPDGTRLAARLWLPENAEADPVPAILEYIPYRKDDSTVARDSSTHPWLAARGYACLRVDMRGSGSSGGLLLDEYSEQEMQDGEDVIAWIAEQPWCDGAVAMLGISWGGITGLQMAQRNAKHLKTVVALGASEWRYYDDAGYYVRCMVGQSFPPRGASSTSPRVTAGSANTTSTVCSCWPRFAPASTPVTWRSPTTAEFSPWPTTCRTVSCCSMQTTSHRSR